MATPHAAASPLESFIGSIGSFINSALTAINNAVSTAFAAITTAVNTAVTAISNTITNLLTAVGVVSRPNQAPTVVDDGALTTAEDTAVSVSTTTLLGNDSDPDGDTLSVSGVSTPAHGAAVLNGTTVTYTPNVNFNGADSFTYSVSDGHGGTATGTVAVTVSAVNDAPVAGGNSVSTAEDTAVSVSAGTLLGNDSDPDGDTLSVTGVSSGAHGSAVLNGATVTYTPNANFNGADSFTYSVSDGHGGTATGTVAVTVSAVNDAPVAGGNSVSTAEDTAVSVSAGTLLGNDSDPDGDTLSVTGVSTPAHGTAVLNGTTVTYTPTANFNGADSFTYTVSDGHGGTATGTVAVTVTPVNGVPVAGGDMVSTAEDTAVSVSTGMLLGNDSDPDGDTLTIAGIGQPQHGSAVLDGTTVTYTPDADFNGVDSLTYTVGDGHGGTATGMLSVTVTPVNDAPTAVADSASTEPNTPVTVDVLGNDVDVDGDSLSVTAAGTPAHGTVVANEDGSLTYTPDENYSGTDSFDYTISDGTTDGTATVTVNVHVPAVHPLILSNFDHPEIQVTASGDVYVLGKAFIEIGDTGSGYDQYVIGRLGDDGSITPVIDLSTISGPYLVDAAVGADGSVYVLNNGWYDGDRALTVYDTDGTSHVILRDGDLSSVDLEDAFGGDAVHLAVGGDGKIYLTAYANDGQNEILSALTVLNADGTVAVAPVDLGLGFHDVQDLAVGPDGRLYVLGLDRDNEVETLLVVAPSGAIENRISLQGLAGSSVAVGTDGTILVSYGSFINSTVGVATVNATGPFGWLTGLPSDATTLEDIAAGPGGVYVLTNAGVSTVDPGGIEPRKVVDSLDDFKLIGGLSGGPDGAVYVSGIVDDALSLTRLARLNADGGVSDLGPVPVSGFGFGSIAGGPAGRAYVIGPRGITVIDTATGSSEVIPVDSGRISYLAGSADGTIYFIGYRSLPQSGMGTEFLSAIDSQGHVVLAPVDLDDRTTRQITGLALGPDGRIYTTSYDNSGRGELTILNSDGTLDTSVSTGVGVPTGVAVGADGTAYVIRGGSVIAVDSTGPVGVVRAEWGSTTLPTALAVGADGSLYVAVISAVQGTGTSSILALDPTDLTDLGGDTATSLSDFVGLYGIAVAGDGSQYVLGYKYGATGAPRTSLVSVSADGASVTQLIDFGDGSGAVDIEIGPDGHIYVTDAALGTLTSYDPANGFAAQPIGSIAGAAGLAFGNGRIYVSSVINSDRNDPDAPQVQAGALTVLAADGSLITTVNLDAATPGVDVGPDGRVYVATFTVDPNGGLAGDGALLVFNADGVLQSTVALPGREPYNVAVGSDGTAYIPDIAGHVLAVGQDGSVSDLASVALPFGIDIGPDGLLYVTSVGDFTGNGPSITVIDPATNV
ncbi:cadherin-like domain-containing protein [Mycolicibacterium aichiense]|uniref:beta strand repeat-containing protein n=1 Tax=Mycolicibacterium aichiense TaxID=1799 RepID=UPI003D66D0AC